jgi:hypothetical protein
MSTGEFKTLDFTSPSKDVPSDRVESTKKPRMKIKLPDNDIIVNELKDKLTEYRNRLFKKIKETPEGETPEQSYGRLAGTIYKVKVLSTLLDEGEVDVVALAKEFYKEEGDLFDPARFVNSYSVINDYCRNRTLTFLIRS